MELGWTQASQPSTFKTYQYKLLKGEDLRNLPPMQWRLKGVLPRVGLAALYGPSASGKSFLTLDLCIAIAEGQKWFGLRTTESPVIYVALEGESGFKNRVAAWELEKNRKLPINMHMVLQPFQVTNQLDLDSLADSVPHDSVVIIDTLNRAAPTSDENSSKDMGEILQACKRLQGLIGGLVLLIHHTGKDTSQGARGHSSFFAALDGAIEVRRTNDKRSWSVAKAKDGQDGNNYSFALKLHELGEDSDGDKVTSCTINQLSSDVFVKAPRTGHKQKEALREFKLNVSTMGILNAPAKDCPRNIYCVDFEMAVNFLATTLMTTPKHKRSNEARRLLKSLVKSGHIETVLDLNDNTWCWIA
jgi:archaellum biogenesis ATPase FlaH